MCKINVEFVSKSRVLSDVWELVNIIFMKKKYLSNHFKFFEWLKNVSKIYILTLSVPISFLSNLFQLTTAHTKPYLVISDGYAYVRSVSTRLNSNKDDNQHDMKDLSMYQLNTIIWYDWQFFLMKFKVVFHTF